MPNDPFRPGHVFHVITVGPGPAKLPEDLFVRWLDDDENSDFRRALVSLPQGSHPVSPDFLDGGASHRLYQADSNPWHAWSAYRACRLAGAPIPQWVLAYLDAAFLGIEMSIQRKADGKTVDLPRAIADAFGFNTRPGRGDVLGDLLDGKVMEIGVEIHAEHQLIGKKKEAIRSVAERRAIPESTARDYYARYLNKMDVIG